MNQLLFIEIFVGGAAAIAAIYHLSLFIQQRDRFLLFYSLHLFTLSSYIAFKLISNNYDPFLPTDNIYYYVLEEIIQVLTGSVYCTFIVITIEVFYKPRIVQVMWIVLMIISAISIFHHLYNAYEYGPAAKTAFEFGLSRFTIIGIALIALTTVSFFRKSVFQRTIIIGSFVYAFGGLLSCLSFVFNFSLFNLVGVEPYLICCFIDIIIFSSAFGYRIKKMNQEKNELLKNELNNQQALLKERNRISADLHDDIGSGLTKISMLSDLIVGEAKTSEAKTEAEKISTTSKDLVENIGEIIWALNSNNDFLENLIAYLRRYAAEYFENSGVKIKINLPENIPDAVISGEHRRNIFLVVKEALNNVLKHAEATETILNFYIDKKIFSISIQDNGKGLPESGLNRFGNGLRNMENRMNSINGNFKIENHIGTKITLSIELT